MKGGRCEACEDEGVTKIRCNLPPDVDVTCNLCKGKRCNREPRKCCSSQPLRGRAGIIRKSNCTAPIILVSHELEPLCLALRQVRTSDLNHTSGPRENSESEAVQFYNRGYQIQAKAEARCVSDLIRPVETPYDGVTFGFAYAGTGILDAHDVFAVAAK